MHRTEGPDYVDEGVNLRRHKISPPPGTVNNHEFLNAVQEEIVNAVEYAGLTLESSAVNDRTAGWVQLRDAIFDSEAIDTGALADDAVTSDKIAECDLSKLSYSAPLGGTDIDFVDGGTTYTLKILPNRLDMIVDQGTLVADCIQLPGSLNMFLKDGSGVLQEAMDIDRTGLNFADWTSYAPPFSTGETVALEATSGLAHTFLNGGTVRDQVNLSYNGLDFDDSGYDAGGPIKFRIFDFDSESWSGTGPYTATLSPVFSNDNTPISAQFSYRIVSSGVVNVLAASTDSLSYNYVFTPGASSWDISVTVPNDISGATYDQRQLIVWYTTP